MDHGLVGDFEFSFTNAVIFLIVKIFKVSNTVRNLVLVWECLDLLVLDLGGGVSLLFSLALQDTVRHSITCFAP